MDESAQHDGKVEETSPVTACDLDAQFQLLTTTTTHGNNNTLMSLPTEIHSLVLSLLPWRALLALRLAHPYFAIQLLPYLGLSAHHTAHQTATYTAEVTELHKLGYSNRDWTDFTQDWGLSRSLSLSPTLPCYTCLRWLPAATDDNHLTSCAFTRSMATKRRDLAQQEARRRVCIECGIRRGLYVRGNRVGHRVICYGCGGLGVELGWTSFGGWNPAWYGSTELLKGYELRLHHFCRDCVERDRGREGTVGVGWEGNGEKKKVVPDTEQEFHHWREWRKYEGGMAEGKKYRLEKGRRLRAERGIVAVGRGGNGDGGDAVTDGGGGGGPREPPHLCPVMLQKRWCQCWKGSDFLFGDHDAPWVHHKHVKPLGPEWIW